MTERYCSHAERNARAEALRRLKAEHGITLAKHRQSTLDIANAIRQFEPSLSGDPMLVIRAWLDANPRSVATTRQTVLPKRPYSPAHDRVLMANLARLVGIPKPVSMTTKAKGNWPEDLL